MSLFSKSGNTDIEGATVLNACYGGTAALLNALAWVDSNAWDGRFAIVVAADIAVYADGPARPTGGCGAVAMLVGRNAPLQIDLFTRTTHSTDVWDFFKPNMNSEYPEVNGALSQTCYLKALDDCYLRFVDKSINIRNKVITVNDTDYFLFHSPYNKLVQKSFARLLYVDMINNKRDSSSIKDFKNISIEASYEDKELENVLKKLSQPFYEEKVSVSCELSKQIGNTYTASVYMNLANLVSAQGSNLLNKSIVLFSYGSGALASMFSIIATDATNDERFSLERIQQILSIPYRLASRSKKTPEDLTKALQAREGSHGFVPFKPTFNTDDLYPGTFYLDIITEKFERIYKRKDLDQEISLAKAKSRTTSIDTSDVGIYLNDEASESNYATHSFTSYNDFKFNKFSNSIKKTISSSIPNQSSKKSFFLPRNATYVWASGRPIVKIVVTGISAALPGRNNEVYPPGRNNIQRIISGECFISNVPNDIQLEMLEKNVVEIIKNADGSIKKVAITDASNQINVCASIGNFSLVTYGVVENIVNTMDRAVQVAVAAGLEALKDAGIVSGVGEGTSGWELPVSMQNTTGIVYATSFPALDAAIAEVTKYFKSKLVSEQSVSNLITRLRQRLEATSGDESLSADVEDAIEKISKLFVEENEKKNDDAIEPYEFDRKFLFRLLVLGNAQLAQIIKARGPNMQTNAACAGYNYLNFFTTLFNFF
jgi:hydroxymethylglutaryl-CoA synthase